MREPSEPESPSRSIATTLLRRAKDQDEKAWQDIVNLFGNCVLRWFKNWGVPEDDIPDLVQGVFLNLSTGIHRFQRDRQGDSFRGWLWTIARNRANDFFRTRRPVQADDSIINQYADYVESESDTESAELLHRILDLIKGDFQETTFKIFWLIELEGQDARQVASDLGIKPSTVREAKRRVKNRLRDECLELLGKGYWPFDSRE